MSDLRETAAANEIEDRLDDLAQGNKGDAEIEKFELNGTTISFRAKIRHWHRVRPCGICPKVNVYKIDNFIDGSFDITNPGGANLDFTIGTPLGPLSFDLVDAAKASAGMIG